MDIVCSCWSGDCLRSLSLRRRFKSAWNQFSCQNDLRSSASDSLGLCYSLDYLRLFSWLWRYNYYTEIIISQLLHGFILMRVRTGFVNRLLSWKGFLPLGRLCYCVYLIHYDFLNVYYSAMRKQFYYTLFEQFTACFGFLVVSFGMSFVVSVTLEASFLNLEKLIFYSKPKGNIDYIMYSNLYRSSININFFTRLPYYRQNSWRSNSFSRWRRENKMLNVSVIIQFRP